MSFDLSRSVRRIRPQRKDPGLARRADYDLPFAAHAPVAGPELLLDTGVYIDVLQNRTPPEADVLLQTRIVNHSTIALSELTHRFGRLEPGHAKTRLALKELGAVLQDIPAHRLTGPSARAAAEAGMLAGLTARLTGRPAGVELLNDALLFLQAHEIGHVLLTANIADFDHFDQLLPGSRLLFYRQT